MSKEEAKSLEEKIDSLINEFEFAKLEIRRKDILSKVDGLYNVLIALLTFIVGLLITQRNFLFIKGSALPFLLIGVVLTLLFSFALGFHGMVKNSMLYRLLSWGLLLSTSTFFLMLWLALNSKWNNYFIYPIEILGSFIPIAVVYLLDRRLCELLGMKKKRLLDVGPLVTTILALIALILFLSFLFSWIIGYFPAAP